MKRQVSEVLMADPTKNWRTVTQKKKMVCEILGEND
jgi:hypothetical protein